MARAPDSIGHRKPEIVYEVGYKRPPRAGQFKPGQSGNPSGRPKKLEMVDHPAHYGGKENPYEAIKVILAWGLGFRLGNAVKYIARAGKKHDRLEDLMKARWYLDHEIQELEGK